MVRSFAPDEVAAARRLIAAVALCASVSASSADAPLEERAIDYRPIAVDTRYLVGPRYPEELLAAARAPREIPMRHSLVGTTVMGLYDPATHTIEINPDDRYGGMTRGFTRMHERFHAANPDRHPDPVENERLNRYATFAATGDHAQLHGYHL